jgi:molecular chaperone GrpE (heat shock protein)
VVNEDTGEETKQDGIIDIDSEWIRDYLEKADSKLSEMGNEIIRLTKEVQEIRYKVKSKTSKEFEKMIQDISRVLHTEEHVVD